MTLPLNKRIDSFVELGKILGRLASGNLNSGKSEQTLALNFQDLQKNITSLNSWFTPEQVKNALLAISRSLDIYMLEKWLAFYPDLKQASGRKKIGVIIAGNIPLVGFHDFLSVLITNNIFIGKLSRREGGLLKFISKILTYIEPEYQNQIRFLDENIDNIDALIATGSDNTARYFNYSFKNLPTLIRKNRNGIAVLDGSETAIQLKELAKDVFSYFGLGCRNVSKIYVPESYSLKPLILAFKDYKSQLDHQGYRNNYKYQLAIANMGNVNFTDSGFLIFKNNTGLSSPIGTIFYQEYLKNTIHEIISLYKDQIQCVVGNGYIPFGKAQEPELREYADGIDTIKFLLALK
ncbi:MAG: acyl-CoA reductase [Bacteroidota bacterium]|nr:acyl-CoA reductase [Bacteroidota bacterium]